MTSTTRDTKVQKHPVENEEGMIRMLYLHDIIKDAVGGLLLVPIDSTNGPLQILDSATSDGVWLRDVAGSLPSSSNHTFIGTDISTSNFPKSKPANTRYQIQDINSPWPQDWKGSFSIVHQSLALINSGPNTKVVVNNLLELVKPGGWIQITEADVTFSSRDGPAMHAFISLMRSVLSSLGVSLLLSMEIASYVKAAGFVDMGERVDELELGATNEDRDLAEKGIGAAVKIAKRLVRVAKSLPSFSLPFPKEMLDTLPAQLEAELSEIGGTFPVRTIWARKPSKA